MQELFKIQILVNFIKKASTIIIGKKKSVYTICETLKSVYPVHETLN